METHVEEDTAIRLELNEKRVFVLFALYSDEVAHDYCDRRDQGLVYVKDRKRVLVKSIEQRSNDKEDQDKQV
jgi:hypothetical protein